MGDGVLEGRSLYPNEIFPPRIMLKQTHLIISRFSQPFPRPVYILTGRNVLPWWYLRSVPAISRNGSGYYLIVITPISMPQCPHLIIKSGYRHFLGVIYWIFVPDTASIRRVPHFGQQIGLLFFSSPLGFSSFLSCMLHPFLCIRLQEGKCRSCYVTPYATSPVSHGAIGRASTRAFR